MPIAGVRNGWSFYAALGPPIFWALRIVIAYPLVPVACQQQSILLLVLLSAAMLLGTLSSGLVAWLLLRRQGEGAPAGRAKFMAKSGLILAGLFSLIILAESVPMFFQDPCLEVDLTPRKTRWTTSTELLLDVVSLGDAHAHRLSEVPSPEVAWRTWNPDPLVLVALLLGVTGFVNGLRRRALASSSRPRVAHAVTFGVAVLASIVALLSPVDTVSGLLFSAHMAQHLILMLVAAPLLALARPGITMLSGLPLSARRAIGRWWRSASFLRGGWRLLQRPVVVLALHVGLVWAWHTPRLYDAALEYEALHVLEHACFFGSAWLFWSTLARTARGAHGGPLVGLGCLFVAMISMGGLSALLAVAPDAFYPPHAAGTAGWSVSSLEDQQLAGLLMWVPGGLVYLLAAVLLGRALLRHAELRAPGKPSVPLRIPPMPEREGT